MQRGNLQVIVHTIVNCEMFSLVGAQAGKAERYICQVKYTCRPVEKSLEGAQ